MVCIFTYRPQWCDSRTLGLNFFKAAAAGSAIGAFTTVGIELLVTEETDGTFTIDDGVGIVAGVAAGVLAAALITAAAGPAALTGTALFAVNFLGGGLLSTALTVPISFAGNWAVDNIQDFFEGHTDIRFTDSNGDHEHGIIYTDSYTGSASDEYLAVNQLIGEMSGDVSGGTVTIHEKNTGNVIGNDTYHIFDGEVLQDVADVLGVSLETVKAAGGEGGVSETNAYHFKSNADGDPFLFFGESDSFGLKLPVELNGESIGIAVQNIYEGDTSTVLLEKPANWAGNSADDMDAVIGSNGVASITATSNASVLISDATAQTLTGGSEQDILLGYGGNDTLDGGAENDVLDGGDGNDSVSGGNGDDIAFGGAGDDTIEGGNGIDLLEGGDGSDTIHSYLSSSTASSDASTIYGGDGNDVIHLSKTQDVYIEDSDGSFTLDYSDQNISDSWWVPGSPGNYPTSYTIFSTDTYLDFTGLETLNVEAHWQDNLTLQWDTPYGNPNGTDYGTITIGNDGEPANGDLTHVGSKLVFTYTPTSSNFDDNSSGLSSSSNNAATSGDDDLSGNSLDDEISGGDGNDNIVGNNGNDTLNGGNGTDTLEGGAGADSLDGGDQKDTLDGGDGSDTLDGGGGQDKLTGGTGSDVFKFSDVIHSIDDGGANNNLYDRITDFEVGIDQIDLTGLGFDTLVFNTSSTAANELRVTLNGSGTITYVINNQSDFSIRLDGDYTKTVANGGAGILSESDFMLDTSGGSSIINGTLSDDVLTGTSIDEEINGLAGNDTIDGAAGDDTIDGGAGQDKLTGGTGADAFKFSDVSHSIDDNGANNNLYDRITDFVVGEDVIDLVGLGFTGLDTDGGSTEAGELRLSYSSNSDRTYVK